MRLTPIQKGKKVYDYLETKALNREDKVLDLYYRICRGIIEKLEELKDLKDDIDRISGDEFDPTRYGFSEGGIANKDMVRFLFDDNKRITQTNELKAHNLDKRLVINLNYKW